MIMSRWGRSFWMVFKFFSLGSGQIGKWVGFSENILPDPPGPAYWPRLGRTWLSSGKGLAAFFSRSRKTVRKFKNFWFIFMYKNCIFYNKMYSFRAHCFGVARGANHCHPPTDHWTKACYCISMFMFVAYYDTVPLPHATVTYTVPDTVSLPHTKKYRVFGSYHVPLPLFGLINHRANDKTIGLYGPINHFWPSKNGIFTKRSRKNWLINFSKCEWFLGLKILRKSVPIQNFEKIQNHYTVPLLEKYQYIPVYNTKSMHTLLYLHSSVLF